MTIALTLIQLQSMCATRQGGIRATPFLPHLNAAFADEHWGINTKRRLCYFMAQTLHECGEFQWLSELASGRAYDNRADLGNTRPEAIALAKAAGKTPGEMFKGEGLIQVTGYDNMLACSRALFKDDRVVKDPTLLREPKNAVLSALWFWDIHHLNDLADRDEFTLVTKRINGGTNGIEDRLAYLKRCYNATREL